MPCYYPVSCVQMYPGAKPDFRMDRRGLPPGARALQVPCGRCVGCRLERSRQWAVRAMHELQSHDASCFLTLTYAPEHLPSGLSLVKRDVQLFIKRLRERINVKIKVLYCGEYGSKFLRPHYHLLIYGWEPIDKRLWKKTDCGFPLYSSAFLEDVWGKGYCPIGAVTFESAAYVARYIMKKVTGDIAEDHYRGRLPEFMHASRGFGKEWIEKYAFTDVYPKDFITVRGRKCKPPRYYDKFLEFADISMYHDVKSDRAQRALDQALEQTPDRLEVRRKCLEARIKNLTRTLESDL